MLTIVSQARRHSTESALCQCLSTQLSAEHGKQDITNNRFNNTYGRADLCVQAPHHEDVEVNLA